MKVFLDSNIIQHSATAYRTYAIQFGGGKLGTPLVRNGPVETVNKKPAPAEELRNEIFRLPELAAKLRGVGACLVIARENYLEIRKAARSRDEHFYGSRIYFSEPPPEPYNFVSVPSWMNTGPTDNSFHNFLHDLKHPRFLKFAKCAGAIHGSTFNYNQLADAYFLWCAEVNQVDYFLTLDGKLQRAIENSPTLKFKTKIVSATGLLHVLDVA